MRILKITGNMKFDGIIAVCLGLLFIIGSILSFYIFGYPEQWLIRFGGELGSFLVALSIMFAFNGIILFFVGFLMYKYAGIQVTEFGEIPKSWTDLIVFFSVLLVCTILVLKGILSTNEFIEVVKYLIITLFGSSVVLTTIFGIVKIFK